MIADLRGNDVLSNLAGRIVDSYHDLETIEHLDQSPLPNFQVVIGIAADLKEIIFPGYHQCRNLHWTNVAEHVGDLLKGLYDRLKEQIACAPAIRSRRRGLAAGGAWNGDDADKRAREKALAFLQSLPELRRLIATDVQAAYDGDPAAHGPDEIIFCYPGLEAVTIYRLAHGLHSLRVPLVPRMMTEWAHSRTGIDIHPGRGSAPVSSSITARRGDRRDVRDRRPCQAVPGRHTRGDQLRARCRGNLVRGTKRHPTIERKVVIYANATILGAKR